MIKLTATEALYIEEALTEVLSQLENKEEIGCLEELNESLNIIRSCNVYKEMEMLEDNK